jgi:hypothetical protein
VNRVVYKYPLAIDKDPTFTTLTLPYDAVLLHGGFQQGAPFVWALVDLDQAEVAEVTVQIAGTGHKEFGERDVEHIDSVLDGAYVWHFFEILPRRRVRT